MIGEVARDAGYRFAAVKSVDSTNAASLRLAQRGDAGQHWLIADVQTDGKGRRGRPWVSYAGNLHASLLLGSVCEQEKLQQLPFVLALALFDAVLDCCDTIQGTVQEKMSLKWPNDLLLNERKVAGILIESILVSRKRMIICGFGVNCASVPADTEFIATSFQAEKINLSRDLLFSTLADQVVRWLEIWSAGKRFDRVRTKWLERSFGLGLPVRVNRLHDSIDGTFDGLDESGRMILRRSRGAVELISSGDVFRL